MNDPNLDREIAGAIWTSRRIPEVLETISYEMSPRPAASDALAQAFDHCKGLLTEVGCPEPWYERVECLAWEAGESSVEIISPRRKTMRCMHHSHSATADIRAPLVDAGGGTVEEMVRLGSTVEGAVVLVDGCSIRGGKIPEPLQKRYRNLAERGAAGILAVNGYMPGGTEPAIECACVGEILPVPALGISWCDGYELRSLAAQGKTELEIRAGGRSFQGECRNLLAELGEGEDVVLLSAHLDSCPGVIGTLDNLSGVATVIEIARALAPFQDRFTRRLRLALWTAEEYWMVGSRSYVRDHADALDEIAFMLNCDGLFPETARGMSVMWSPEMRDYAHEAFVEMGLDMDVRNHFCMSSDYLPFMMAGIATSRPADWWGAFPPVSHSAADTPANCPARWIRLNAQPYAQLLIRLLTDPAPLPTRRLSPEEAACLLDAEGVDGALDALNFQFPD